MRLLSTSIRFDGIVLTINRSKTSPHRFLITGTLAIAGGRVIMSKAFVFEVRSRAVGIVVHDGRRYWFYAAAYEFNGLEGRDVRSPNDAQKAAVGHIGALDSKAAGSGLPRQQEIQR